MTAVGVDYHVPRGLTITAVEGYAMTKTPSLRGGYAEAIQANSSKGTGLPRRCAARNDGGGCGLPRPAWPHDNGGGRGV